MHIFDITLPLFAQMPVYPGDPPFSMEPVTSLKRGDGANVSRLSLSTHTGTHLDVPRHLDDAGADAESVSLSLLVGEALVADLSGVREIGRKELARLHLADVKRLLLKTDNSTRWSGGGASDDDVFLAVEGAEYLLERGVRLVGIDALSVEPETATGAVHRLLLEGGAVILEGINLEGVAAGRYELICLPLRIRGGDGAPARALLRSHAGPAGRPPLDPHTSRWPLS